MGNGAGHLTVVFSLQRRGPVLGVLTASHLIFGLFMGLTASFCP